MNSDCCFIFFKSKLVYVDSLGVVSGDVNCRPLDSDYENACLAANFTFLTLNKKWDQNVVKIDGTSFEHFLKKDQIFVFQIPIRSARCLKMFDRLTYGDAKLACRNTMVNVTGFVVNAQMNDFFTNYIPSLS